MFETIHEIDDKISKLSTVMESCDDDIKESLQTSISSLFKEKYCSILEEKDNVDGLFESGLIDGEDYDQYVYMLEKMESETEKIAYPYLTEAAAAVSVTIVSSELDELKSSVSDKVKSKSWIKKRVKMFERICKPEIPFSTLSKKKISSEEFQKLSKIKVGKEEKDNFRYVSYEKNGKPVCVIATNKSNDESMYSVVDSNAKKLESYYILSMHIKNKMYSDSSAFISLYKTLLKKESSKLSKEVKECVLDTEKGLDGVIANINEAVQENVLDDHIAYVFKDYATKIYEKAILEDSLEKHW